MSTVLLQKEFICYCLDGVKFIEPSTLINFNLTSEGVEILGTNKKQLFFCEYSDINDIKILEENKKQILNIFSSKGNIKLFKPVASSVQVIKEMLMACIDNKEDFFAKYDIQQEEQKKLNFIVLNVFLWIVGISCLFSIFSINEDFLSSICMFIAGILIFPPIYNFIKKYSTQLSSKKVRIWSVVLLFILSGIFEPQTTTAYIKSPNTIICREADGATGFKKMNTLEEINVYKDNYKTNGFLKISDGNWVKENAIVYANTQEYKDIVKAEEQRKKEIEKAKQEIQKLLNEEQENLKKELKIIVEKAFDDYDLEDYSFIYYANPIAWYSTTVKEKENIMQNCAVFGKIETKQDDMKPETALAITKIKSSSNGEVLGEYSIWSGFKFK